MTLKTLAAAACMTLTSAIAASAATFTVNDADYDITTITGSFDDNSALIESQIWWDNRLLAFDFALEVKLSLPGAQAGFGPSFAYELDNDVNPAGNVESKVRAGIFNAGSAFAGTELSEVVRTFAIATPVSAVPLPAGGLLLLTGLGGVAALKRRKKRTA